MVSVESYREAERAVVGSALLDPESIRFALDHCTPDDFHDPRLGRVWSIMIGHRSARLGVDEVTIAKAAAESGITGIDPVYLFDLRSATPTASNVAHYAQIVHEGGVRRRLRMAGQRMIQLADGDLPISETMANARGEWNTVQSATSARIAAKPLAEVLAGSDEYDWLIPNLLERQDRVIITGGEGAGKALALDTPIPTPSGWTVMGDLAPGDLVLGADGRPTRIVAATDVMRDRECFRVEFSDGSHIIADAEHQWLTETYASRIRTAAQARRGETRPHGTDQRHKRRHFPAVVTTRGIAETLHARGGHTLNHTIPAAAPLDLPDADLPLSPYTLGAWLGDGHSAGGRISIGDQDRDAMLANLEADGWPAHPQSGEGLYGIRGLQVALRSAGVLGDKHIPAAYLRASHAQRLALLQGLMDTDGTVSNRGAGSGRGTGAARCEFCVTSERLARDTFELVISLGVIARLAESDAVLNGRVVGRRWRLTFQTDLPVFRLPRKAERITPLRTARSRHRFVTAVVPVESVPVRCIQVDNSDQMYLAGERMIPTHNSTLVRQIAVMAAAGVHPTLQVQIPPVRVLVVDVENTEKQWRRAVRTLTLKARLAGTADPAETMHLACHARMDLTTDRDLGAVHRLVDEHDPELLLIGPIYRLIPRAINSDDDAAPVIAALDTLRERGLTLVLEAHAGHALGADGHRNLRPRGSAALLGWPEFGLGIAHDTAEVLEQGQTPTQFRLVRWRGDRDERAWPESLRRGGAWPWEDDNPLVTRAKIRRLEAAASGHGPELDERRYGA